ncbi:MAG: hypothetical protein LUC91_08490, partial [Prevotella sp.]|nr:hypothetical protein [Prevotella sp.]
MNGVILFADDKVLEKGGFEYKLYRRLCEEGLSVLPIDNLETLEDTVRSMSTFKALILDWNFDRDDDLLEELEGAELSPSNPKDFLCSTVIYSFIYV